MNGFMVTLLILSTIGLLCSRYNERMAKLNIENFDVQKSIRAMLCLRIGFMIIILFVIGSSIFNWQIEAVRYILLALLVCTVVYVSGVSVNYYFDNQDACLKDCRDSAFNEELENLIK